MGAPLIDIVHLVAAEQACIADGGENGTTDQYHGGNAFQYFDGLGMIDGCIDASTSHLQRDVGCDEQCDVSDGGTEVLLLEQCRQKFATLLTVGLDK